jgi:hypothetical protein
MMTPAQRESALRLLAVPPRRPERGGGAVLPLDVEDVAEVLEWLESECEDRYAGVVRGLLQTLVDLAGSAR